MTASPRLLMFTRFPAPGQAKTRLIPALGPDGAAAVHRTMTERTLATLRAAADAGGMAVEVWVTGGPDAAFRQWLGPGFAIVQQGEGDLGARMARALAATPAILVGSDLPDLQPGHIAAAAALLAVGQAAFGPAEDGGYYLVALPAPAPFLFTGMAWSTAGVMAETRRRLHAHGVAYGLLPTLPDLDKPADLARFPNLLAGLPA